MKKTITFTDLIQWPAVFLVLGVMLDNKWPALVLTLALAYRCEVSAVIRRLTVVEMLGFKSRFGKEPQMPRRIPGRR
jgi:hypothetical protein